MSGLKWSRRTTQKVAEQLALLDIHVSAKTVSRLLKSMGYSLRTNRKSISHTESPQRNEQFEYISHLREQYASKGQPIISVDTKKKEWSANSRTLAEVGSVSQLMSTIMIFAHRHSVWQCPRVSMNYCSTAARCI